MFNIYELDTKPPFTRQKMDNILDICHQNRKNLDCFSQNPLMWFNAAENLEKNVIEKNVANK